VFWYSLYLTPAVWLLFALVAILQFSFTWLLIVAVAVTLSIANAVGYQRCQRDAVAKRAAAAAAAGGGGASLGGGWADSVISSGVASALGRIVSESVLARART
jgi:hypothetical protein